MEGGKGGREAKSREGSIEEGREGGKEQGKLNNIMQSTMRGNSENTNHYLSP